MKLAYLTNNDWPGHEPGLTFSLENARGLRDAGADFRLYLRSRTRDPAVAIVRAVLGADEPLPLVPLRAPPLGGSRLLFYARAFAALGLGDRDTLVFRGPAFLPWAVRLRRWKGMRVVFEAHDFWMDPSLRDEPIARSRWKHVRREQRWLPDVDGILCVSEPQAELYRRYVPSVPVAAAPTACKPPHPVARDAFSHTLGYVGSLDLRKYPLAVVLEALARVPELPVTLLCVGAHDAGQRDAVLERARELGVEERVEVHGWAHGPALRALEERMDVGVAVLEDSFLNRIASPLKVLEYLAAGLPFVATRLPGIEALVQDGEQGLLVPNEAAAWADALRRIYADFAAWQRMAKSGAALAAEHSWKRRAQQLLDFLERDVGAP